MPQLMEPVGTIAMDQKEKHPKGLYVLFFTEMWERFGFYSMLAMFVLYLKKSTDDGGMGWGPERAAAWYSIYLASVYFTPLIGGYIADRKLGYRNCVLIGGFIFMIGYFLLSIREEFVVYISLACLVIGNGFFKPNVSAMVGHLYPEGSALKDRAYNIFYMGINVGALMAPINCELMVNGFKWDLSGLGINQVLEFKGIGFNNAFAIAGFGMILSIAILWFFRHLVDRGARRAPTIITDPDTAAVTEDIPPTAPSRVNPIDAIPDATRIGALIVIFAIVVVFWMVFHQNGVTLTFWGDDNTDWNLTGIISNAINPFWVVVLSLPVVWMWGWLNRRGLEPSTPTKMMFGMFLTASSFGILYFAAKTGERIIPTPDMLDRGSFFITDRTLTNLEAAGVPKDVVNSLDRYEDKGSNILWLFPVQTKKADADWFTSLFMTPRIKYVIKKEKFEPDKDYVSTGVGLSGKEKFLEALKPLLTSREISQYQNLILKDSYLFRVSYWWLIIAYAVMTLGELMLSPMGLSLVSKVAPVQWRGLMMGGWFVATSVGNALTMIAIYWYVWLQSTFFAVLGCMALAMGVLLIFLLRPLKKAMPGV